MSDPLHVSVAFAPTLETPKYVELAEQLGFRRAWLYDTPQQSPDVWMCLALAAERTRSIGIGPGVLVPTLRHPMVNAGATAALERLAPGRVAVGFGTGHTGRRAMGVSKPIPWPYMFAYIKTFQALLRGEIVEWEGSVLRMLPTAESLPVTPVNVPVYIAALGPKGLAIAKSLADGVFVVAAVPEQAATFDRVSYLAGGSVLDDGEALDSARLRSAAGPMLMQTFRIAYELGGASAVVALPGGPEWLAVIEAAPADERHLVLHTGHLMYLNDADAAAWGAGAHALLPHATLTGTSDEIRRKTTDLVAQGVTEIVYQPAGDIRRELETFADAMGLTGTSDAASRRASS